MPRERRDTPAARLQVRKGTYIMNKQKNDRLSYGIVGLDGFGFSLAQELAATGAEVLALDFDEERVREIRDLIENAMVMRNPDKKSLEEAGIQNCDVVIVSIGEPMDTSILTTLNVVSLGVPTVIAKATSPEHGEILAKLGAQMVYPERDMAIRLAHRLQSTATLDFVQLSERVNISKFRIPEKMVGKNVRELELRGKFGLNIVLIERDGHATEQFSPDYIFDEHDIVFVIGDTENLNRFTKWIEK